MNKNNLDINKIARGKKKNSRYVIAIFMLIMFLSYTFLIAYTMKIQITGSVRGVDLKEYANSNLYETSVESIAKRGDITTENGDVIATSVITYDMYAVLDETRVAIGGAPDYVTDPEKTADTLLKIMNLEDDEEAVELFHNQLLMDAGEVEFSTYGKSISKKTHDEILKANLPGVKFKENYTRTYPYNDFASYSVGFTKIDENGYETGMIGAEQYLDGYLRGENANQTLLTDGNAIPISQEQIDKVPQVNGSNVELTINSQIQMYLQDSMDKYLNEDEFDSAFSIAMDAETGGIVAANAMPSFDPNERNLKSWTDPYFNYCFEPGSTMKTITIASAMEAGVWDPNNTNTSGKRIEESYGVDDKGQPIGIGDWIYNVGGGGWGDITWEQGYYYSSNTTMSYILDAIGKEQFEKIMTETFLFGKPFDTNETFYSANACEYNPKYEIDYANTTFGQGMKVNAMQMLRAYSPIVNGGDMLIPHFVNKIENPENGEVIYDAAESDLVKEDVISEKTATDTLNFMRGVVTYEDPQNRGYNYNGTASDFSSNDIPVAVKTGTAQISDENGYGTYGQWKYIHSDMIAVPAEDPEMLYYIVVVNDKDQKINDVVPKMTNEFFNNSIGILSSQDVEIPKTHDTNFIVDNYLEQDSKEVSDKLLESGIEVEVIGNGKIVDQYPQKGQVMSKNQKLYLRSDSVSSEEELRNLPMEDAKSLCYANDWDCTFNGFGSVASYKKEADAKYYIELKPPYKE